MSASIKVAAGRALIRTADIRLEVPFGGTHGHLQRAVSANITGTFDEILVSHTVFSGSVVNNGIVGSGGIVVISSTLTNGSIVDDNDAGGIKIDSHSKINPRIFSAAIAVGAVTSYGGGISNGGTLAGREGIFVGSVNSFGNGGAAGGISNSGKITAARVGHAVAIEVIYVTNFAGGIVNQAAGHNGIVFHDVLVGARYARHIGFLRRHQQHGRASPWARPASSSAARRRSLNRDHKLSSFGGGIVNSGTISAGGRGIFVGGSSTVGNNHVTIDSFTGGISNSGKIKAGSIGIQLGALFTASNSAFVLSTFTGGYQQYRHDLAGQDRDPR